MTPDEFREDIARQAVVLLSTGLDVVAIVVHPRTLLSLRNKSVFDPTTEDVGGQWFHAGVPVWRCHTIAGPLVVGEGVLDLLHSADLLFY